jgi:vancomycin resistance protein YoaR
MSKSTHEHKPQRSIGHYVMPHIWFFVGFFFAAMFLLGLFTAYFRLAYQNKVIPGVYVDNVYVGEKTEQEIRNIFDAKSKQIQNTTYTFSYEDKFATISAQQMGIGYDSNLITTQALSLGKTNNIISNIYIVIDSFLDGTHLHSNYTYKPDDLKKQLEPLAKEIYKEPVNAQFTVENNRVSAFSKSEEGQTIDFDKIDAQIKKDIPIIINSSKARNIPIKTPVIKLEAETTTEEANNLGIVEELASGKSYFAGSIPNRMYNISLAASRVNGVLVAPGEEFSFNKAIGDVSKYTGYKEAYVIQAGKTVLGDGGGVCQVSTTLFRAVLNAGLPITERHGHAYRVGYYEQQSGPGLDATVYVPSVDFKFKNDTDNHILIQGYYNPEESSLTFTLYGKKDDRIVAVTNPVITSQTPPPDPVTQDDPSLPKDTVKQVEYAASGAVVSFKRTVQKEGKTVIDETFTTHYRPWGAIYLHGTKEG